VTPNEFKKKLQKDFDEFTLNLSECNWFDLWHIHVDWDSIGNEHPELRKISLNYIFKYFDKIVEMTKSFKKAHQIFVSICLIDSGQDAVYLHTENPNGTEFPYNYGETVWISEIPSILSDFVELKKHDIGFISDTDIDWYVVKMKDVY